MRTRKVYAHVVKRTLRPEWRRCLHCQSRLQRCVTISARMVITLTQVIKLTHCGYRCPVPECPGAKHLYRSAAADALALAGFTFGLDILILVGQLRLSEHKTVAEIHRRLSERLAPLGQTLSRREILFLFEAYSALLRAGTEVEQDEGWKAEVRKNNGLVLSIDGIQPDKGNETISLVREVLTGRMLTADTVTESTTARLKEVLAPVVALGLPVIGVSSDAQPTQMQAVADLWPGTPHQLCQFHVLREAGRLMYNADHRAKTAMRMRMQEKTHTYRHDLHTRLRHAPATQEGNAQERAHLEVLESYAATVEGALTTESRAPFGYGGLALQEALTHIHTSVETLEKKGAP